MQQIKYNLNSNNDIFSAIRVFSEFSTSVDTELEITFRPGKYTFINNDVYLIISSFVNEVKKNGNRMSVSFPIEGKSKQLDYASRIDFFRHLKVEYLEDFKRHKTNGNFIEIKNIHQGSYNISERFEEVFSRDFGLNCNDINNISFMIDELICNMTMHSKSMSGAYFYCQKFPMRQQIEITIVDSGIGIANSLSKAYPGLENYEYLSKCIEFEVTSGEGRGHGLYFTSEFMRRNNCEMSLISGENMLKIENERVKLYRNPSWNGVILKLIINFDIPNSIDDIVFGHQ